MISILGTVIERKPVLLAAFLSALTWDFLFIPPRFTFYISATQDWLILALYFVLASTAGLAGSKLKRSQQMLALREKRISLLRDLAANLAGKNGIEEVLKSGAGYIESAFEGKTHILLAGNDGALHTRYPTAVARLDEKEESAASYCYRNNVATGKDTSTLPVVAWHFVPMEAPDRTIGVVGIKANKIWTDDAELFLRTLTRTLSLATEREILAEKNRASALEMESERVSKLILDSVSHELRTPLTVIKGGVSVLLASDNGADPATAVPILGEIQDASERLDAIIGNLLSMNRLESGRISLHCTSEEVVDLVSAALESTSRELRTHTLSVELPDDLPAVFCDAGLVVQILVNLLRNAATYSGLSSAIAIEASRDGDWVCIEVRDNGQGVSADTLPHLFEKFYRAPGAKPGGTGLGLSICKGVVEAHGGYIKARLLKPSGLAVVFALPGSAGGTG